MLINCAISLSAFRAAMKFGELLIIALGARLFAICWSIVGNVADFEL